MKGIIKPTSFNGIKIYPFAHKADLLDYIIKNKSIYLFKYNLDSIIKCNSFKVYRTSRAAVASPLSQTKMRSTNETLQPAHAGEMREYICCIKQVTNNQNLLK